MTDSGWRGDRRTLWTTGRAERIDMYADPRIGVSTVEIRAVIRTHDVDDNLDAAKRAAEDALRRFCREMLAALGDR